VKLVCLVGFITKKFVMMHGHMNVKIFFFLTRFEADRQAFFSWIANSRWNVSFSFWNGHERTILGMAKPSGSRKEKLRKWLSAGKVIITTILDCEEVIVVGVMPRWKTAHLLCQMLQELGKCLK
jgi:amino acid permease